MFTWLKKNKHDRDQPIRTTLDEVIIDQSPPVDWRTKYERAHERELRQMRRAERAEAALEDARRLTATQGDKIMRQRDAFKAIAAQETPGANATVKRMAAIANEQLGAERTKEKA